MANWRWEGLDKTGKRSEGSVDASNEREVRKILRAQGVRVRRVVAPSIFELDLGEWMVDRGLASAFTTTELTLFTRQLSTMINAGVPILQSLEILYKSQANPTLKRSIRQISVDVGEGKTLAEAIERQKGFTKLYSNLVKAGEQGGILDTILDKMAEHMESTEKIKREIKGAMIYPAIVTAVGIGVICIMMIFVVPMFMDMLKDSKQEVPMITQFVVNMSHFFQDYALLLIPGLIGGGLFFMNYIKSPQGKPGWDAFMMKTPVFGGIVIKGNLNSFTRTLGTMLSSGIALIEAMDICIETVDNTVIKKDLKKVRNAIVQGKTLTEPLLRIEYFPELVAQMIKVGEQTGALDQMLNKVSAVFEEEVRVLIQSSTKLIEPLIIVFLGGFVALILVAMYLPVFTSAGGL